MYEGREGKLFHIRHMSTCEQPTTIVTVESISHLPSQPGELRDFDLFGPGPVVRGSVRHILVCLELFTKHKP